MSQHLSFFISRKAFRSMPGSERYSGNPTVADRRGACGNVELRAPQFYPDPSAVSYADVRLRRESSMEECRKTSGIQRRFPQGENDQHF